MSSRASWARRIAHAAVLTTACTAEPPREPCGTCLAERSEPSALEAAAGAEQAALLLGEIERAFPLRARSATRQRDARGHAGSRPAVQPGGADGFDVTEAGDLRPRFAHAMAAVELPGAADGFARVHDPR